jgi:8-oxo-dGTP pyrophosphatase MutT (NUDIX family)
MANASEFIRQAAALPVRNGKVCLVTSSNGNRWVIPKGLIEPGETASATALREAWEEAGVVGVLNPEPLGSFFYQKWCGTCHVTVYLMQVTEVAQRWPEGDLRERSWLTCAGALGRIDEAALAAIVRLGLGKKPRRSDHLLVVGTP